MWGYIAVLLISLVLSYAMMPGPPEVKPKELSGANIPFVQDGAIIPWVFGERQLGGYNVVWFGDLSTSPIFTS